MLEEQEAFFTSPHVSVHKHKELPGKGSTIMRPGRSRMYQESLLGKSGWRRQRDNRKDVMMMRSTSGTPHRMPQRHRQVLERNTLFSVPSTLLRQSLGLESHTST